MKISRRTQLLVVALVLCTTMMIGSTLAWFTDSVQTKENNVITTGNLSMDVQYTLGEKDAEGKFIWQPLEDAENLFLNSLWEPGHTEVIGLKIQNTGSLALKYKVDMRLAEEVIGKTKNNTDIKLSEILKVDVIQRSEDYSFLGWSFGIDGGNFDVAKEYLAHDSKSLEKIEENNVLLTDKFLVARHSGTTGGNAGLIDYVIIRVDMPETTGNEANHDGINIPSIKLAFDVVATQDVHESKDSKEVDGFGYDYDINATYPELNITPDEENSETE